MAPTKVPMLMQPQAMVPMGFDPNAYYMPGISLGSWGLETWKLGEDDEETSLPWFSSFFWGLHSLKLTFSPVKMMVANMNLQTSGGSIFRENVSFREGKDNKKWFPGDLCTSFFLGGGEGKGGVFPDVLASFSVLDIFFRLELSWKRGVKSTSILDRNCEWLMLFLVGPLLTFKVEGRVFQ